MGSGFLYQTQNTIHSLIASHIKIIRSVGLSRLKFARSSCLRTFAKVAKFQPPMTPRTGDTKKQLKSPINFNAGFSTIAKINLCFHSPIEINGLHRYRLSMEQLRD
ncbi:hypothetical protein FKM82_027661 [Ascaphus truei]